MSEQVESGMSKEQREARDNFLADVRAVAELEEGRRFLAWLFERGRLLSSCFTASQVGTFMQGEQNLALDVFLQVQEAAPVHALGLLPARAVAKTLKELQAAAAVAAVI